jgi:hypothetical protein
MIVASALRDPRGRGGRTESGKLGRLCELKEAIMDLWSWLRVGGCWLIVGVGFFGLPGKTISGGIRLAMTQFGYHCLSTELEMFRDERHFQHEKLLKEMDVKSHQLQQYDEVEMLHLLEDFWTARDEV